MFPFWIQGSYEFHLTFIAVNKDLHFMVTYVFHIISQMPKTSKKSRNALSFKYVGIRYKSCSCL